MQLSKETLALFKNASSFNGNFLIKAGSKQSFMSSQRNVVGSVTLAETFPQDFGIYDMNEFLGVVSLFDSPELSFEGKFVKVSEGENSVKFYSADASVLLYPQKEIVFPDVGATFQLTERAFAQIQKTSSVLRASDVLFEGDGTSITVSVLDKANPTGNSFKAVLGSTDKTFKVYMKVDNLKFLSGDYKVEFAQSKRISRFSSTSSDLTYIVAVESDSTDVK